MKGILFFAALLTISSAKNFYQYCVIGAGPGGLQMGYFLQKSGRDYVIFEKGSSPGTFYTKYPIHRKLISINKRYTGQTNKEFNLRHDWNSLLSDDESLLMTKYSKEFFPEADVLVKYLNDYAIKLRLNLLLNTEIKDILKQEDNLFHMKDNHNNTFICQFVVIATGIAKPNNPNFDGAEFSEGYENQSLNLEPYEGQSVLILGRGNSAYEVAQHIMSATNFIHMLGRSRVKLAWATHYVGDLRAVNNGILDTYQLKSLDGLFEGPVEEISIVKSKMNGKYYLVAGGNSSDPTPGGNVLPDLDNAAERDGYDRVIRCLGFTFDESIFHPDMSVRRCRGIKKKYPFIRYTYESVDVRNLYFAGANTHSLDFRKSAGAFIHGYRYTTRTLHRLLEWKNHAIKWPYVTFHNLNDLIPHILKRLNEASDIYQMFGVLCEVVIYNKDFTHATYLEAVPCALGSIISKTTGHEVPGAILMIAMEYGKNFSGPGKDPFHLERATGEVKEAHKSNFLHPVLYHYNKPYSSNDYITRPKKWILPVPDRLHHIVEDFTTKFNAHTSHVAPLRRFVETTTRQDLRFYYGKQCMMLAMTQAVLPHSCRISNDTSSHLLGENKLLASHLVRTPAHLLPLEFLK